MTEQDFITKKLHNCRDQNYPEVSDIVVSSLELYLTRGIMPGSFLTACLENNLSRSVDRADSYNSRTLKSIVGLIYNGVPSIAWGSPEKVVAYLDNLDRNMNP